MLYDELDEETAARFVARQNHLMHPTASVYFKPGGTCLPRFYADVYDSIRNFEVRSDDVYVLSVPKSGTTWTQEMVWILGSNFDYEGAKTLLNIRFPNLEFDGIGNAAIKKDAKVRQTSLDAIQNMKSPRFIKTHLHVGLLPKEIDTKKPKIVFVARNPKDQCVSMYHHKVLIGGYKGTMDEYIEEYLLDYYLCGPFWPHVREFWNRRNDPNVLFIKYEDMKKDLRSVVLKTAEFLGKTMSDTQLEKLLNHLSFESMKSNPAVNNDEAIGNLNQLLGIQKKTHFIRKGKVDSWKEELSAESVKKLDDWIAKNRIDGIWENI